MKTEMKYILSLVHLAVLAFSCSDNPSALNTGNEAGEVLSKERARDEFESDDRFQPTSEAVREALELKKAHWKPSPYCIEAKRVKGEVADFDMQKKAILNLRKKHGLTRRPVTVKNDLPPILRAKNGGGQSEPARPENASGKESPPRGLAKRTSSMVDLETALNHDRSFKPRRVFVSQWFWEYGTSHTIEFFADVWWQTDAVLVVFQSTNYPRTLSYAEINTLDVVAWDDDGGPYTNPSVEFTCTGTFPFTYYFVVLFSYAPWFDGDGTIIVDGQSTRASATGYAYWGEGNKSDNIYHHKFYQTADNTSSGADPWIWVFDLPNSRGYTNDDNWVDQQDVFYYSTREQVADPDEGIDINGTFTYLKSGGDNRRSKIRTFGYSNPGFDKPNLVLLTGYNDSEVDVRFVGFSVPNSYEPWHGFYVYPDCAESPEFEQHYCLGCHSRTYQ